MARERELSIGREDPDVVSVGTHGGHERALGEPDLARHHEHRVGVQVVGSVEHDAELVALERSVREHVEQLEGNVHAREYARRTR